MSAVSTAPVIGAASIPLLVAGSVLTATAAVGGLAVAAGVACKNAIDKQNARIDQKYTIQNEAFELVGIQGDYLVSTSQIEKAFEYVVTQSKAKFSEPIQQLEAEKAALFQVAQQMPVNLIGSPKLLSATQAVNLAKNETQLSAAKTTFVETLKANTLNIQHRTLKHVISEVGQELDFPMEIQEEDNGKIRLIGKDKKSNQAIVSEIHTSTKGEISIKNEILNGGCDDKCVNLLHQFNKKIEQKGIRLGKMTVEDKNRRRQNAIRQQNAQRLNQRRK